MNYYTIFLGDKLFEDVIDDMNSSSIWGIGGMLWIDKEKALACMENYKNPVYGLEDNKNKFSVKKVTIN